MTGVSGVKSRKLYEVMDTITVTNHADIEFIVVDSDWWAGLTTASARSSVMPPVLPKLRSEQDERDRGWSL